MEEDNQRELQLLLPPTDNHLPETHKSYSLSPVDSPDQPLLDLSLSMCIGPVRPTAASSSEDVKSQSRKLQVLKQQTIEQIRLASVEKAYAERVRETTRKEMEMAEKEFARARLIWERAKEEMEKVERMKEMATKRVSGTCIEITCQRCKQRFHP